MRKILFALTLFAMMVPSAVVQDSETPPPITMNEKTKLISANPYEPPFCPPGSCLYYAGDYNSSDSDANGLFNSDDEGASLEGTVWVGVKPDRDATVTGATFVEMFLVSGVGVNPTPFAVQVRIRPGQAGKTICNTSGNATESVYGANQLTTYSYTIKKLSKACKLKKGKTYYVNLLPTFDDNYGFLANVEDAKPKNHHGWKNDLNHCYFNFPTDGYNYFTCNSLGIGMNGFSEFSIALTGKE